MSNTCTGKIQIPITGSTTDGVAYIAANHPNGNIADYTFFITPSEYNSVMSPTNNNPFVLGGAFGQTAPCAVYDSTGAILAYQVYVQTYKFIHILAPPGQYGGPGTVGPYDLPASQTYSDFVDSINMNIHLPLIGVMLANINTDWYTVCEKANSTIVTQTPYNNSTDTIGCQVQSVMCSCPATVINPCATTALNTGVQPTNVVQATYSLQASYVTGNYIEWPIGSGDYWFLYAVGYTVNAPFIWANNPTTNPQTHDAWIPCGVDPGPIENPNMCPTEFLCYQDLNPTPYSTYYGGAWDPNIGYQVGETFSMDWYSNGLGMLLSHSDPNWVTFISSQGLSNPISQFELPAYDWGAQGPGGNTGSWLNQGSGTIIEFLGNCNNVPGVHEYISLVHNIPPFNDATPNDWADGMSIPGLASTGGIGIPYWQTPGVDDYPGTGIPNDVVWYAQQGLAMVNGEVACCQDLIIGCMDPLASNYNANADIPCPDLPQMGTDQWGNPVSLGPPDGLPDCCEYKDVGEVAECLPKLTKEEFLMNVAQKPETRSDVFIERGKTSVFERTQRLAQTPTIGELTIHGYGYYKINEQRF